MEIVQGHKIQYQVDPIQVRVSQSQKMNADQSALVNQEIENKLHKGAFRKKSHVSGVFKQPVSDRQIRWRKEASDKLEQSKFIHTIPAFQNRGPLSTERSLAGGGLHVQDRSYRCIFYNTDKSKGTGNTSGSNGREPCTSFFAFASD